MKTMKTRIGAIDGKPREMTYCERCGVWFLTENFEEHKGNGDCDRYLRTRAKREGAEKIVNEKLRRVFK